MALLRGATQVLDASINISKIVADFLDGSDWDITNGNNNATITGLANGVNPHDAVNYQQLIDLINGRQWKDSVRAFADINVTLSGNQTIDGIALADGDRVACLNQTTTSEDGVYVVNTGGAWTRATDWASGDGAANYSFYVEEGTSYADTQWTISNDSSADTIGTHDLIPSQTGGAGTIVAGAGLTLTGNTVDVNAADNSILVNADDIQVQIGNTNGNSLETTATGLELLATITGDRTFSNTNFTISSTGNVNINNGTESAYIFIGNTASNGVNIKSGAILDFSDKQVNDATTTTAIPLAIQTTIDHGSGTADGDIIDDFRAAFTDEAIINALVELHDSVTASGNDLSQAYYAGSGTTGTPVDYHIDMNEGNIMWKLAPNANITDSSWTIEDGVGAGKAIIAAHSHYDGSTQDYSSLHLYANAYAGGSNNSKGIDIKSTADGSGVVGGEINIETEVLNGATGADINVTSSANIHVEAIQGVTIGSSGDNVILWANKFLLMDSTHTNLYQSELEGLRLANYATASLPTVQTGSFGSLVFDTDDDRPKVWVTDSDGGGTDGWLKVLLEGDASVYTFENGLTESSGTVRLGGILNSNTSINISSYDFTITNTGTAGASFKVNMNNAGGGTSLDMDDGTLTLQAHHPGTVSQLDLSNSGAMTFTSGTGVGIEYNADYSAGYTLRSLVDKEYVDKKAAPMRLVRVFSDANVDITSAPASIDGVTLANGDLVALFNQTTTTEDGIYVYDASGSAMTRSSDFDTGLAVGGYTIVVEEGTNNADKVYLITNDSGSDVVGTDDLVYTLINGASLIDLNTAYENGAGSVASPSNQTIEIDSGDIQWKLTGASTYTPATYSITNETGTQGIFVERTDSGATNVYTGISLKSESNSGTGEGILITDLASGGTGGGVTISTTTGLGTAGNIVINSANTINQTSHGNMSLKALGATSNIEIEADKGLALNAYGDNLELSTSNNLSFYAEGNVVNWYGYNDFYEAEHEGFRFKNYATASLPTIGTGYFGAVVFDTDDDRLKLWVTDSDGSGTDGWLKLATDQDLSALSSTLNEAYEAGAGTVASPVDQIITMDSGDINWTLTPDNSTNTSENFTIDDANTDLFKATSFDDSTNVYSQLEMITQNTAGTGGGITIKSIGKSGADGGNILIRTEDEVGVSSAGSIQLIAMGGAVNISGENSTTVSSAGTTTLSAGGDIIELHNGVNISSLTNNINFQDNEINHATTTTAIPFAITTTIDHGSGTASGNIIDDFRATFTDEAIINAIMENHDAIVAGGLTAGNGLQIDSGEIQLGNDGTPAQSAIANLTRNTSLTDNGNDIRFIIRTNEGNDSYNKLYMNPGANGTAYTLIGVEDSGSYYYGHTKYNADGIDMVAGDDNYESHIKVYSDYPTTATDKYAIRVESSDPNFKGAEYGADYSSHFVDRSLVDKAYVDNAVANGEIIDEAGTIIDANAGTVRITGYTDITKVKVYLNGNRLSPPEISSIANGTGGEAGNTIITINSANQVLTAGDAIYVDFIA